MQITEAQPGTTWTPVDQHVWDGTIALVCALVSNPSTQVSGEDLQSRIRDTFATLLSLRDPAPPQPESRSVRRPTEKEIEDSIGTDALISFVDGRPYKTLKRHLHRHGMTPDQYRDKWNLPSGYPMAHTTYSQMRSEMAKKNGLGRGGRVPRGGTVPARHEPEQSPSKSLRRSDPQVQGHDPL
jgi:predicted transcriptional regulator